MPQRTGRLVLITGMLATSFLAGSWLAPRIRIVIEPTPLSPQAAAQTTPVVGRAGVTTDEPVARAVALASPCVVNIDTVKRVVRDDFFWGPQVYERKGAGSGVVIDRRGYILTNDHVVSGANQITVTFSNGKQIPARVLYSDAETDVGVVQLREVPKDLVVAKLGDARKLMPGQWAIAIGNPYGYQQTVTLGVIGHTGRAVRIEDRVYKRLIQTDAAINPGNSGGALVDIHGRVIGINTVVRADAQGIGFAIPIDLAKSIADELIRNGKIQRPWIGMYPANLSDLGWDAEGIYVEQIVRNGPAWQAGVRPGDVIRELGGRKIRTLEEFEAAVAGYRIGQKVPVVIERDGERYRGEVLIAEKP